MPSTSDASTRFGSGVFVRAAIAIPLLLLGAIERAAAVPPPDAVQAARKDLAGDELSKARAAIEVLFKDGGKESLKALVEFGAGTRHLILTNRIGEMLPKHADPAMELLSKLRRRQQENRHALGRIALMAARIPGDDAVALITALTRDRRPAVAARAVEALGVRADPGTRGVLLKLLKSKRPDIAQGACIAIGYLPPDDATKEALFKLAMRGDQTTGGAAAVALTRMPDVGEYGNRAWAKLGKHGKYESFHALAKIALWAVDKPDPKLLRKALRSSSAPIRELACDVIGVGKIKGHHDRLLQLATSDKSYKTRIAAWLALRRTGIEEIRDSIRKQIRGKGENAYWAIQCAASWPHESLLDALHNAALDVKDRTRRDLASVALGRSKATAKKSREFFLETWGRNRGAPKGRFAVHALGQLKDVRSFNALVGLLETEKKDKNKLIVLEGLERMTGHYYKPDATVWRDWLKLVGGKVAYEPATIDRGKNRERVKKIKELGVTAETEDAVERGLSWLARHQAPGGRWSGERYFDQCVEKPDCKTTGGLPSSERAYTGLALLAFQGAGYTHRQGAYHLAVSRGITYMIAAMNQDGSHHEKDGTFVYEAAIVAQALSDAHALTGDRWIGAAAQRSIDYLAKIQTPGGLWRYRPRDVSSDTSVMSWVLMACVSARQAGLDVPDQMLVLPSIWLDEVCEPIPPDTFEVLVPDQFRAENRYFQDVSRDQRGKKRTYRLRTYYNHRQKSSVMQAVAIMCRIWLGWTRAHPFCVGSANQQLCQIAGYSTGLSDSWPHYPYTWYYGSLAMYQMGGRYWKRWRDGCLADLIKHQRNAGCQDGSWKMPSSQPSFGGGGGTAYCTSMAILALESFYRYQPYLARVSQNPEPEPEKDR